MYEGCPEAFSCPTSGLFRAGVYTPLMDERILFWGLGGLLGWALFSDRPRGGRKRCPKCWYDMAHAATDDPLRCPECGHQAKRERRLFRTRRKWRWVAVGVIVMASSWVIGQWPEIISSGWSRLLPNTALILFISGDPDSWAVKAIENRIQDRATRSLPDYPIQFQPDRLWGWQWRLLARRTVSTWAQVHVKNKFTSHDNILLSIPLPWKQEMIPVLLEAVKDLRGTMQGEAAQYLVSVLSEDWQRWEWDQTKSVLLEQLESLGLDGVDPGVISALTLFCADDENVLSILIECLQRPNHDLHREAAVWALSNAGGERVVQALLDSIPGSRPELPIYFDTLEVINIIDPENPDVGVRILELLEDRSAVMDQRMKAFGLWRDGGFDIGPAISFVSEAINLYPLQHVSIASHMVDYWDIPKEQRVSFLNQILAVTKDLEAINVAFIGLEWAEAITSEHEVYAQRLVDKGNLYQRDHGQQVLNFIHNIPEK